MVFGFVNRIFDDNDGLSIVPDDVIGLIVKFYQYEILHVLRAGEGGLPINNHWTIDASLVLC